MVFLKGFFCHLIKGTSRVIQQDQPILHRDVQRLEDLCINHVGHRLPGHQNPINSLGTLPHAVCDKILMHLMKNKSLSPKAMQAFISWYVNSPYTSISGWPPSKKKHKKLILLRIS